MIMIDGSTGEGTLFANLDDGDDVGLTTIEFVFSKAVAKQGIDYGRTYNLINPTKAISDFNQKVENLKKSM
jgi:hypothetical protein